MKRALITLMMATMMTVGLVGLPGCDASEAAAELERINAEVARLEAEYGPLLDDPNAMAGLAGDAIKERLAAEMKKLDERYAAIISDPNRGVQRGVAEFDRYAPAARGVVSILPTPAREAGLAILGIAGTIAAAIRGRRWKTTTEELLYARDRLEKRVVSATGIDEKEFKVQREKAEGEALNPKTAKLIQ